MNTKNEKIVDLAEHRAEAQRRKCEPITYNLKVTHIPNEMTFSISGLKDTEVSRTVIADDLESVLKELRRHP